MLQFFGQLMKLPMEAFVYSMEMFVKTMRGIQQIAFRGIDLVADEVGQTLTDVSGAEKDAPMRALYGAIDNSAETVQPMPQEEGRKMSDRDLRDDMLKLVRYKVLFVKRDYEHVFYEKEELVHENIDAADYTGWKIAEFIQSLKSEDVDKQVKVPPKWKSKGYPKGEYTKGEILIGLEEDDKKYLRVYYEVLDRYTRERFKYEEEQIDVLREIRDSLKDKVKVEEDMLKVQEDIANRIGRGQGGGENP